jgi:hypothetical protein
MIGFEGKFLRMWLAECMAARLVVERKKGSATEKIATEASLPRRSMNEGSSPLIREAAISCRGCGSPSGPKRP